MALVVLTSWGWLAIAGALLGGLPPAFLLGWLSHQRRPDRHQVGTLHHE